MKKIFNIINIIYSIFSYEFAKLVNDSVLNGIVVESLVQLLHYFILKYIFNYITYISQSTFLTIYHIYHKVHF